MITTLAKGSLIIGVDCQVYSSEQFQKLSGQALEGVYVHSGTTPITQSLTYRTAKGHRASQAAEDGKLLNC